MTIKTLLLSFLTSCTANSAVAQTFNEVEYSPKATTFQLTTSPDVKKVNVLLSDKDSDNPAEQMIKQMKRVGAGKWKLTVKSDLKGKYYLFSVYNNAQPDNTPGIFAKAVGVNGKRGAIVDLRDTDPEGWSRRAGLTTCVRLSTTRATSSSTRCTTATSPSTSRRD